MPERGTFGVSESCYRYSPRLGGENAEIADLLIGLTNARKTWGFGLCFLYLRNVQGRVLNHKRVCRITRELELNLRIKPRKRLKRDKPDALAVPDAPNAVWSIIARQAMHGIAERGRHGRSPWPLSSNEIIRLPGSGWPPVPAAERAGSLPAGFCEANAERDFNREGLGIEVDFSLPTERVVRSHTSIIEWRGLPGAIRVDNSPEYISGTLMEWAETRGISIRHIQPGKPQQNAYIERYNRTVRHEWLDQHIIETIEEAQDYATQWLWTYNNDRPNIPFMV
jgi:putative transposase